MGYYIETPAAHGKANYLIEHHGATIPDKGTKPSDLALSDKVLICVIDNGPFEAAAYCYNDLEYNEFNNPADPRPRRWLLMDRAWVAEQTGYRG